MFTSDAPPDLCLTTIIIPLFRLMLQCWQIERRKRPTFAALRASLGRELAIDASPTLSQAWAVGRSNRAGPSLSASASVPAPRHMALNPLARPSGVVAAEINSDEETHI
jgi:hypothetical protein